MMAVRGGSLPDEISEAIELVKLWTEERLERSSSRMEVLAEGKWERVSRRVVVLVSVSEALRTVPMRVQPGCWLRRCWIAGIAREPLAPVMMNVPAIVGSVYNYHRVRSSEETAVVEEELSIKWSLSRG